MMPHKGIWIDLLATGEFNRSGGSDQMTSLCLWLEEGFGGNETRGSGISGVSSEASTRGHVRDEKGLIQGRDSGTSGGESWGRQAGGQLQKTQGQAGLWLRGRSQSGKTLVLKELSYGQDQGKESNASESSKVQVLKVGHGILRMKLRGQHGIMVMSIGL